MNYDTPIQYDPMIDAWVKREDLSTPHPGPRFSKTRGVLAHIRKQPAPVIGVLDTVHSQGGHAVAYACSLLGKQAVIFYPVRKHEQGAIPAAVLAGVGLGASIYPLPAGRSAVLYHAAQRELFKHFPDAYMMPNALKLPETVDETREEARRAYFHTRSEVKGVVISASSGTVAAGVVAGMYPLARDIFFIVHQGYTRPVGAMIRYMNDISPVDISGAEINYIDEEYQYSDEARPGPTPSFPCNKFYDLKAYRWLARFRDTVPSPAMFWNIG